MRILLIDDDRDFVEATRTVLASLPCDVDVAFTGQAGLAHARAARPDLIILDVVMPGESGYDVLEQLDAEPGLSDIPVILLTSLSNGVSTHKITRTKPFAYLVKPVKPAELLRRVGAMAR